MNERDNACSEEQLSGFMRTPGKMDQWQKM